MDSARSDRPQRRTALVGRELDRYKVEIAALSETPCRGRGFERSWCWLHLLLEWTQERRAAWSRSRIRHQVTPRQQALRTSKMHNWPPDDAETFFIWQEACNNCKCLCIHNDQPRWVKDKFYDDLDSVISAAFRTQTHPPWGLQCQSGHRSPKKVREKPRECHNHKPQPPPPTPRGRGNRQTQTSTNRTNVRKALRLALSSPSEVIAILKGLKNTRKKNDTRKDIQQIAS